MAICFYKYSSHMIRWDNVFSFSVFCLLLTYKILPDKRKILCYFAFSLSWL